MRNSPAILQEEFSPLSDVISLVRERRAGIPHETAAFMVLQACEAVLNDPRLLDASTLLIDRQGGIRAAPIAQLCPSQESARSLARLLQGLLRLADEQVPRDLADLAEDFSLEPGDLTVLRERLISALLPLNRDASRRVLARFARDLDRMERNVSVPVAKNMESQPVPRGEHSQVTPLEAPKTEQLITDIEPLLEGGDHHDTDISELAPAPLRNERRRIINPRALFVIAGVILMTSFGYMLWKRSGRFGEIGTHPNGGVAEITLNPPDARVLSYVGRSPLTLTDIPIDQPGYVIAFDDGTNVAGAELGKKLDWQSKAGTDYAELAMQMSRRTGADVQIQDPPADVLSRKDASAAERGEVRVVTNPPQAKVYLYQGKGPVLRVSNLDVNQGHELLVYRAGYVSYRIIIGPSDWQDENGKRVAKIDVRLPKTSE